MLEQTNGRPWTASLLPAMIACFAVLVAACGSGPAATARHAGRQSAYQQALMFAHCMRAHGERDWPAPSRQGNFDERHIDISSSVYTRSLAACLSLRPAGAKLEMTAVQRREVRQRVSQFVACMHSHGQADAPATDPGKGSGSSLASLGLDPSSPLFQPAMKACGAVQDHNSWIIPGT